MWTSSFHKMQVTESNVLNGCYLHSCLKNCQTYLADFQGHRVFYAYYGRYIVRVMLHHSWHKFGAQFLGYKLEFLIAFSSLLSYTIIVILKLSVRQGIKVQKSKNRGIWYRPDYLIRTNSTNTLTLFIFWSLTQRIVYQSRKTVHF